MKRRMVLAQMAVFLVIAVLVIGYAVVNLLGVNVTSSPYKVKVQLDTAGGIFNGAEVAYRGVQVGRVTDLQLGTSLVTLTLSIEHGKKVPDNSIAHIYDLSAVGEQYVDLVPPPTPSSTFLHANSVITADHTTTPLQVASVLYDLERFVDSVNPSDVQIIGTEGAAAFANTGPQLKSLLADATSIIDQLSSTSGAAVDLIRNAATLLHGAAAHSGDFDVFARSVNDLTSTLASSTPTVQKFLQQAGPTTTLIDTLISQNGSAISVLLGDLTTLSQIQVARVPGLKSLLVAVPEFGEKAPTVVHNGALLAAGDVNFSEPDCPTGVPLTSPISGIRTAVRPVSCNQNILARGAANAPRPDGEPAAATPSSLSGQSVQSAAISGYDPSTGLTTTPDGSVVQLGSDGGQSAILGKNSWQALIFAGTGN